MGLSTTVAIEVTPPGLAWHPTVVDGALRRHQHDGAKRPGLQEQHELRRYLTEKAPV